MEAFIARQVDVIHLLMPMALYMRYHLRVPAKVLTWNHVNGSALTLHPEYTDLAQLSGHTLAIPSWFSIHNVLVQRLLRQADLVPVIRSEPRADQREVGLIVMAPSDMIPALANRTIAGFTVADPFNAAAALGGSGRIRRVVLSPTVMLGGRSALWRSWRCGGYSRLPRPHRPCSFCAWFRRCRGRRSLWCFSVWAAGL